MNTKAASAPMPPYCCDLHNVHCEPPGDLCCPDCAEAFHPHHRKGDDCVLAIAHERKAAATTRGETR